MQLLDIIKILTIMAFMGLYGGAVYGAQISYGDTQQFAVIMAGIFFIGTLGSYFWTVANCNKQITIISLIIVSMLIFAGALVGSSQSRNTNPTLYTFSNTVALMSYCIVIICSVYSGLTCTTTLVK